jgi:8-amino-7-oxononanoate synthase
MDFFDRDINSFFETLQKTNRERKLEVAAADSIDLCSNDYLCLSQHPQLIAALKQGIDQYGGGSTASRLIRGHRDVSDTLEQKFAAWVGAEAALFFANGYAANVGCISAICDTSYDCFTDRLAHASLLDGVRLSGARKVYFRHNDVSHLEELLAKSTAKKKIIITESLFSMDGDRAPLAEIAALKEKYSALLYVDDAHAIGVYGDKGRGLAGIECDFRMATLGKALGLEGAFMATSAAARKFFMHSARTFVFSTAPLPAVAHAGLRAIDLVKGMDTERQHVETLAQNLRAGVKAAGRSTGTSDSHIIPVLCASEAEALELAQKMQDANLHIKAIRPPTVKESRLRISLNAGIDAKIIERISAVLV